MRPSILATMLLSLASCALSEDARFARIEAEHAEARARHAAFPPAPVAWAEHAAVLSCEYQARVVRRSRNVLVLDLEGAIQEERQVAKCLEIYRLTGKVP